jgi:ABC-type uncharacterized transport system ATPase subunit
MWGLPNTYANSFSSGAVLLVSEDLEEIFELSDRIAVIFNGTFMGIVDRDKADLEDIGLMMAGTSPVTSPVKGESRPWV